MTLILSENALSILKARYCQEGEETWEDVCKRVSKAIAYNESENKRQYWEEKFYNMLINMCAIPGGRILRNAGTKSNRLLNCHVLPLDDSIDSIGRFMHMALVLNAEGGGVGFRPKLRPKDAPIKTKGGKSSGVLSFLKAISYVLDTVETGGNRRSGGLPILDVSHPEIVDFINAKLAENELNNFNISVGITNEFLDAVEKKDKWKLKFGNDEYGEKQAVDLFDMIIENMIKSGEPGLINLDNMSISNSFYYAPIEATNLCSELPLPAFVSCCLGSIVLPKFLSETGRTKWDDLADTIKTMVRFLDNVIDVTSYTFPEMQEASLAGRRIGLGMMGLGDYLLAKKVRYGSPSGLDKTDNVVRFIRDEAYRASIELAKEKGPFLKYLEWPYSKAKFIKTLPASLRMDIKKGGIRNVSCLAYPPSGCLTGNTLISTNIGNISIKDFDGIVDRHTHAIKTKSDFGFTYLKNFFNQGVQKVRKITTKKGYFIEGTYNHKLRVITKGGGYVWKELSDIKSGDLVVLKKDFILPKQSWVREEVAELLGFYMADGWLDKQTRGGRLEFSVHTDEVDYIINLANKAFGKTFFFTPHIHPTESLNCKRIHINSKKIHDWFHKYNCVKDGAKNAFIPDIVLNGGRDIIIAFIRGYFLGDGGFNDTKYSMRFTTVSSKMANVLHTLLLGLGVVAHSYTEEPGTANLVNGRTITSTNPIFRIETSTFYSRKLCNILGLDCLNIENTEDCLGRNFERVPLMPYEERFIDSSHLNIDDGITYVSHYAYTSHFDVDNYNWFVKNDLFIDKVVGNMETGEQHTYDLEVNDSTHTYVANGFVTHNTTSLLADTTSGVEPLPFKAYIRHDRVGDRIYIHPLYKKFILENQPIPNWFVDAIDLSPEEHFETTVTIQKRNDGSISKTQILPAGTSPEQLKEWLLEYSRDLVGITAYVDGSRSGQVLRRLEESEVREIIKKESKTENTLSEDDVNCKSGMCSI